MVHQKIVRAVVLSALLTLAGHAFAKTVPPDVSVGPQYDSTHVYVAPSDMDAFVKNITATFGGQASAAMVTNVLPVPSSTRFRYVWTPAGTFSTFAFLTPVPFPFGAERTGYLVTDLDKAVAAARASGAEVIVAPFKDPIGRDAVVQWPGGFRTQFYWHFKSPSYAPLGAAPDNRVYLSPDRADQFVKSFLTFSHGKVVEDARRADAIEVGRPGETFRRIRIRSGFGNMLIFVTDGHLPYPFGREITGYRTTNLDDTIARARASGARVLAQPTQLNGHRSAMLQFTGGYVAEVHDGAQ